MRTGVSVTSGRKARMASLAFYGLPRPRNLGEPKGAGYKNGGPTHEEPRTRNLEEGRGVQTGEPTHRNQGQGTSRKGRGGSQGNQLF